MTEAERLSRSADVSPELAAIVVMAAERAGVKLRVFRSGFQRRALTRERFRTALRARQAGYTYWEIGRALNRDHSTIINAERRARELGL